MRIVTNADDFGMNDDVNAAVIAALESGALTSATIMPKMPGTDSAVAYARHRTDRSFGVHLTYVCDTVESPVSDPRQVPRLVREDGRFLPSNKVRLAALRHDLPIDQIARETEAQVRSLVGRGVKVSHVDSHGHLHKFRPFRIALRQALEPLGIRRVRTSQDLYLRRPYGSPNYWIGPLWARRIRQLFTTTDHFYMPSSAGDAGWHQPLLERIRGLGDTTLEVGVHPGTEEAWRRDEASELAAFSRGAREAGHSLITWSGIS